MFLCAGRQGCHSDQSRAPVEEMLGNATFQSESKFLIYVRVLAFLRTDIIYTHATHSLTLVPQLLCHSLVARNC